MSSTNDTVFPISFPVQDTTRTRSDIALVQTAIDSLQARNIPLFPDQSAALGKFTLTINKVKNTHDAVAKSMARSTKGITANAFAMQVNLKKAANAAVSSAILAESKYAAFQAQLTQAQASSDARRSAAAGKHNTRQIVKAAKLGRPGTTAHDGFAAMVRTETDFRKKQSTAERAYMASVNKSNAKQLSGARKVASERKRISSNFVQLSVRTEKTLAQLDAKTAARRTALAAAWGNLAEKRRAQTVATAHAEARTNKTIAEHNANQIAGTRKLGRARTTAFDGFAAMSRKSSAIFAATERRNTRIGIHNKNQLNAARKAVAIRTRENSGFMTHVNNVVSGTKKITTAQNKLVTSQRKVAAATKNTTAAQRKLNIADKFAIGELTRFSRIIAIVQGPLGPIAGRLTAAAVAIRSMGTAALLGGLALGVAGMAMRRAIPAAIDLQRTQSTLSAAMNGNAKDTAAAFKLTIAEARRTGVAFDGLAASYAQLAAAARGTVLAGAEINKIFKAVNTASLALRLDLNQTKGVIKAMEQMISKGTVSAEEMRQQLGERLPGAFRLAANAMKMTTAEFSKNMALGKILAEDLLPKLAREMEKAYGTSAKKAAATLGVALNKLDGEVNIFYGSLVQPEMLNAFTGLIDWATQSLRDLGTALKPVPGEINKVTVAVELLGVALLSLFAGKMAGYIGKLGVFTRDTYRAQKVLKSAAGAAGDLSIAAPILGTALGVIAWAFRGLTAAMIANPFGALAVAITAVAGALYVLNDATDKASKKQRALFDVDGLTRKLKAQRALVSTAKEQLVLARLQHAQALKQAGPSGKSQMVTSTQAAVDRLAFVVANAENTIPSLVRMLADASATATDKHINKLEIAIGLQSDLAKAGKLADNFGVSAAKRSMGSMDTYFKKLAESRQKIEKILAKGSGYSAKDKAKAADDLIINDKSLKAVHDMQKKLRVLLVAEDAKKLKSKRRSLTALLKEDTTYLDALKKRTGEYTRTASEKIKFDNDASVTQARAHRDTIIADVNATGAEKKKAEADLTTTLNLLTQERSQLLLRESKKVVDIHSLKFKKIMALGKTAFADETTRLLDKSKIALDALDAEHKRVSAAAASQYKNEGERKTALAALDDYYAQKKIDLAQQTADKIAVIDKTADDAARARLKDSNDKKAERQLAAENAGNELRLQFSQLASTDQQVNLEALATNLVDHTELITSVNEQSGKRELDFKKMTGKDGLSFLQGSLGAISGLMNSHNKKTFKIAKAAGIANATISTIGAVMKAWDTYGWPVGAVLGAGIAAAGALNVAKIASTQFGGSSAPSVASATGGFVPPVSFNPGRSVPQKLTTPQAPTPNTAAAFAVRAQAPAPISIVQNITAPNATVGSAQAIQQAANLGAQQALAAVSADFTNNGALRQTLAV